MHIAFRIRLDIDRRYTQPAADGEARILVDDTHTATSFGEPTARVGVHDVAGSDDRRKSAAVHVDIVLKAEARADAEVGAGAADACIEREHRGGDADALDGSHAAARRDAERRTVNSSSRRAHQARGADEA